MMQISHEKVAWPHANKLLKINLLTYDFIDGVTCSAAVESSFKAVELA